MLILPEEKGSKPLKQNCQNRGEDFLKNREKRKRMIQKKIRLTEEEARFISTKVAESGMANFNAFARIMLILGEVKILNFEELR